MSITSLVYLCVCVCMRTLKFYSLSKFQLYNTVLSAIVTMLYIRSSDCYQTKLGSAHLMSSKANLLQQIVVKESTVFFAGPSKEDGKLMFQRPKLPVGFQGRVFKGEVRERATGCLISSWTFFWLVGGEVTGWYFWSQHHQPSGSNWSGVSVLVVSMQLTPTTWWGF